MFGILLVKHYYYYFFDVCYFLEISLPHAMLNALSVEKLNRLGFNDESGGVCFVYYFCQSATNINILVVSVLTYFVKGPDINFSFDYKEICLFDGYFKDN